MALADGRILPLLCLAYFAQAMDKGATSPISIMGWLEDVGAQGQDYALTSTVLWIGLVIGNPVVSHPAWGVLTSGLSIDPTLPRRQNPCCIHASLDRPRVRTRLFPSYSPYPRQSRTLRILRGQLCKSYLDSADGGTLH
jgi:hypothetical protein